MARFFNTAGPCLPGKHYLLPPERRLSQVRQIVDAEAYFVIHAPRQTGKTTLLRSLSRSLTEEGRHAALTVSLESLTDPEVDSSLPQLLHKLARTARQQLPEAQRPPDPGAFESPPRDALNAYLSAWAEQIDLPLVLFLDEVDAVPGPVLLSILKQLRDGYTSRPAPFPQSVALAGLRDVRDYRAGLRPDGESLGTASPFNIKTESLTLRSFTAAEVAELLGQHTKETGQVFTREATAEVFHQSQGQPWLVNALAAQLTTRYDALVPDRAQPIERAHVLDAREILIERRDTHLDSLVARLHEDRVQRVIEPILVGDPIGADTYHDDIKYVEDLGLVTRAHGTTQIANPIYQEIIPRVLTYVTQGNVPDEPAWYVADDGTLDLPALIQGFLGFWRRHGEVLLRGMPYQEAAPHLVFMAYLQRIVNSGGRVERELAVGTGRADLVVDYGGRQDVIELKLQRGPHTLPDGLEQVARYAARLGRDHGYLVIFDPKSETPWATRGAVEEVAAGDVTVVVVRA